MINKHWGTIATIVGALCVATVIIGSSLNNETIWVVTRFKPTCTYFEVQYKPDYAKAYRKALKSYLNGNAKLDGARGVHGVPCEALYKKVPLSARTQNNVIKN